MSEVRGTDRDEPSLRALLGGMVGAFVKYASGLPWLPVLNDEEDGIHDHQRG